jgi:hypothetical protein
VRRSSLARYPCSFLMQFAPAAPCRGVPPLTMVNPDYYYDHGSAVAVSRPIDNLPGHTSFRPRVADSATASQHLQGVANPAA